MNKPLSDVLEFHKTYSQPTPENPTFPDQTRIDLRMHLITEEFREVREAIENKDLVNLAKELADLLYVVNGTIIEFGLTNKMDQVSDAVHASNMSKLDNNGKPIYSPMGKVLKSPLYREADVASILFPVDANP